MGRKHLQEYDFVVHAATSRLTDDTCENAMVLFDNTVHGASLGEPWLAGSAGTIENTPYLFRQAGGGKWFFEELEV